MSTDLTVSKSSVTKRHKLRKWVLRLALALLIAGPVLFMVAALGYKMGLWGLGFSFGTLTRKIGPLVLMSSILVGVAGLVLAFLIKPRKGVIVSLLAIIVPVAGLMHAKSVSKTAQSLPFIHDITTDTQNPPMFTDAILAERAKTPNVNPVDYIGKKDPRGQKLVSVLQVKGYPNIRPLVLEDAPDVIFGEAKNVAKSLGWKIVSENVETGIIEATDTTFWYGFKDDVIIRIQPSEGGATVLDIRSVSRVGASDIGANAARIRKFTKAIQK